MTLALAILYLILGFLLLIYGADRLVEGASSLARRLGATEIGIGLTIVAFGTSFPELVVSSFASWQGHSEIAIGNIVGSNIANILLILGTTAMIMPLKVLKETVKIEIPFCAMSVVVLAIYAWDSCFDSSAKNMLGRGECLTLLALLVIFMIYAARLAFKSHDFDAVQGEEIPPEMSWKKTIFFLVMGLAFLPFGGHLVVNGAVTIAKSLGISDSVISLTIISLGTSLPELATSVVAALKKKHDIAVGNVIGSNLFNTFLVLGVAGLISPIAISQIDIISICVNLVAAFALFTFMFTGVRRFLLERWEATIMLVGYFCYIGWLIYYEIAN